MVVASSSYPFNPPLCVGLVVVLLLIIFFKLITLCKSNISDPFGFDEAFAVVKNESGEVVRIGESRIAALPRGTLFYVRFIVWLFILLSWISILVRSTASIVWNTYTFWNLF